MQMTVNYVNPGFDPVTLMLVRSYTVKENSFVA